MSRLLRYLAVGFLCFHAFQFVYSGILLELGGVTHFRREIGIALFICGGYSLMILRGFRPFVGRSER